MPQTSVGTPVKGQEGTFATSADRGVTSRVAAEAITVGKFVVLTAGADTCELPDATAEVTGPRSLGFAMLVPDRQTVDYATNEMVTIAEKGEVFVTVEDAVTAGNSVFVRFVAGGGEELGSCRSDADGTDAVALPNAVYKTSAGAGELATVKLWR